MSNEEIFERLGQIQADIQSIKHTQENDIKPVIEDYKKTKNRAIGAVIASMFGGTTVGAMASQIWEVFKH